MVSPITAGLGAPLPLPAVATTGLHEGSILRCPWKTTSARWGQFLLAAAVRAGLTRKTRVQAPTLARRISATRVGCSRAAKCPVSSSTIDFDAWKQGQGRPHVPACATSRDRLWVRKLGRGCKSRQSDIWAVAAFARPSPCDSPWNRRQWIRKGCCVGRLRAGAEPTIEARVSGKRAASIATDPPILRRTLLRANLAGRSNLRTHTSSRWNSEFRGERRREL
jgi:hypothetical protein